MRRTAAQDSRGGRVDAKLPQYSEIHSSAPNGAEAVEEAQDAEPLGEDMGADGEAGDFEGGSEGDAGGDWGDDAGAFSPGAGGGQENAGRVSLGLDMLAVPDKVSTQQVRLCSTWRRRDHREALHPIHMLPPHVGRLGTQLEALAAMYNARARKANLMNVSFGFAGPLRPARKAR